MWSSARLHAWLKALHKSMDVWVGYPAKDSRSRPLRSEPATSSVCSVGPAGSAAQSHRLTA